MMQVMRFFSLLLAPIGLCAAAGKLPSGIEHIRTLDGIEEYRLVANDLRILLVPDKRLPVATVMVTYQVGSRNESVGTTGATHILEHMMFKGTPRFNPEKGNDYSSAMERIGARSNATTWFDRTNYFATVPAEYVPLTIELEADRMRNLMIHEDDLASEMTVVRNEYERGENNPVRTLIKEIFATAYMAHPYGHPTIGWQSDIESTNPEKLRRFYDTYYWPENAVVSVIGGFEREATLEAMAEHYGAIEPAPRPIPEVTTQEPPQLGPRRTEVRRAGQIGVVMAGYKIPEATHEDWPALLLIDQIVGANKTGRLYRALDDKGKASATFTFAPELRDPGLFVFGAYLTPGAAHDEVESILLDEIERLIGGGVTEDELRRAKSVLLADTFYGRDGPYAIASQLNDAIAIGDWTAYLERPKAIEAVTAEKIRDVAARYFVEHNRTTGWFVPEVKNHLSASAGPAAGPLFFRDPAIFGPQWQSDPDNSASSAPNTPQTKVDFSSSMQRAEVAGIEIVAVNLPVENVVSFVGSFAAGDAQSPASQPILASLTAAMLDKGTATNDRFKLAERLDALGAQIGFRADAHSLVFSGQFLREDAGPVMELLAEQLGQPAFDPEVLETLKNREKSNLLQAIDDPGYRAGSQLTRQLYPPEHPNYTTELKSRIDGLDQLSAGDLKEFHARHYGPESMRLVFAGDIDFEQLKAALAIAFEDWEGGVAYPTEFPTQRANTENRAHIRIADKPSVSVRYGYNTGLQRTDSDYLAFMLGNYILGGSFHSRLMQKVRKERGLTYNIRSSHGGDILTPGHWSLQASFSPDLLEQGLAATESVIESWSAEGVSEDEVAAATQTLVGSYLVGLSNSATIAAQLHSFLLRGYPPEYIDAYPEKLRLLDADQVNRAIAQYFDPTALHSVIAGSFQKKQEARTTDAPRKITVQLDTPNNAWQLKIDRVYAAADHLIAVSRVSRKGDAIAAQVITSLSDSVTLPESDDRPVRHYILGKTWNWGESDDYIFIDSLDEIAAKLEAAEQIYPE